MKFKTCASKLLGRLSAADERAKAASSSAKALLKKWSALEQEAASLRDKLSAAVWTSSVDADSKLAYLL